jgi:poly(hydroxyalkanoate) depolymerase family esterase
MSGDKCRTGSQHSRGASLDAALRSASLLTRNHHVIAATRFIQRVLSRHEGPVAADWLPRDTPGLHDRDSDVGLPHRDLPPPEPDATDATPATRHPLGMALGILHRHELRGPGRGGFAPAAPSERAPIQAPLRSAFVTRRYTCAAGSRDYRLYLPAAAAGHCRGLVVMLHGCKQTPDDFAAGTAMNALADERGFIVAYPHQAARANHSGCWNWFNPEDQSRDCGEPSIIAGLAQALVQEYGIDEARVFVAGLSAGGAMAAILAATYPDVFRAAGIHSGLAHGAASDLVSAYAAMCGTPVAATARRQKPPALGSKPHTRTIVFHGSADQTVHPSNGDAIFAAARTRLNGAAETQQHGRSARGVSYTRKVVTDARGQPQLEHWTIDGLGHAWSGGRPDGSYTDLLGPDASREMVRFFFAAEPDVH